MLVLLAHKALKVHKAMLVNRDYLGQMEYRVNEVPRGMLVQLVIRVMPGCPGQKEIPDKKVKKEMLDCRVLKARRDRLVLKVLLARHQKVYLLQRGLNLQTL